MDPKRVKEDLVSRVLQSISTSSRGPCNARRDQEAKRANPPIPPVTTRRERDENRNPRNESISTNPSLLPLLPPATSPRDVLIYPLCEAESSSAQCDQKREANPPLEANERGPTEGEGGVQCNDRVPLTRLGHETGLLGPECGSFSFISPNDFRNLVERSLTRQRGPQERSSRPRTLREEVMTYLPTSTLPQVRYDEPVSSSSSSDGTGRRRTVVSSTVESTISSTISTSIEATVSSSIVIAVSTVTVTRRGRTTSEEKAKSKESVLKLVLL